jgi:hypothetical protein
MPLFRSCFPLAPNLAASESSNFLNLTGLSLKTRISLVLVILPWWYQRLWDIRKALGTSEILMYFCCHLTAYTRVVLSATSVREGCHLTDEKALG